MIVYAIVYHADSRRKIRRASRVIRIMKEQRMVNSRQPSAGYRPVRDIVMLLSRRHVIDVLRIISSTYRLPHTCELTALLYDGSEIPAAVDTCEFTVRYICSVAYYRRHASHSRITFPSGFTLDQPREKFSCIHRFNTPPFNNY